ncbi:MAG: methyltransferase domain-containing protein [Planctomycetota bacterium]
MSKPANAWIGWITRRHQKMVFPRRVRRLTEALAEMLPPDCTTLLDIGCGDGTIAKGVADRREGLSPFGVDVLARPEVAIPMEVFDGKRLPFDDDHFDAAMIVDVLHHCDDANIMLAEAARVSRRMVLIKDHAAATAMGRAILRFMDWVGNRGHGVRLVDNYWSFKQWQQAFQRHGLTMIDSRRKLGLYPLWARPIVEWGKHFIAALAPAGTTSSSQP